jgi:predicted metalloendopeptidase
MLAAAACPVGHGAGADGVTSPSGAVMPTSGIEMQYVDASVRPADDPYRYLNGKWLDTFQIPEDKATYGAFNHVDDATQEQLRTIVEALGPRGGDPPGDPDARKLADLYASFMDEPRLESQGLTPLAGSLAAIARLASKHDIPGLIARFNETGIDAPYDCAVTPDPKDSAHYIVTVGQSGLGLPDRDYYLEDDPKLKEIRAKYLAHVERMLAMAGERHAHEDAAAILKLETSLAARQWTRVENRDPIKTYNKVAIRELPGLMPGYDWPRYLGGAGLTGKIDFVVVRQPSYLTGLGQLIAETPLDVWKSYFKWQALSAAAPYLSKAFVDERFAFRGGVLSGIPENKPRWKRGLDLLDDALGEALGRLYVERYFPPQNKARMQALVGHLIEAYRGDIATLDWMGEETRKGALAKLDKLVTKIGYPDKWRDYSALKIARDDLWGNIMRATAFEHQRDVDKLGKPVDRTEWFMTPQTVNAYYNPVMNEIVFPASILQPPFFDMQADDAVNYGGIGAVIGHEISHGFDDKGSQYDADGNLDDWFTPADHEKFAAKTRALVAQYDAYEPVPGFHVNGKLTLGENIADNSGLAIALKAYRLALADRPAPVLDGLTGEQRFFLGWVQVWRGKVREAEAIRRIKVDPHSPPSVRGSAPLVNQAGFYEAFGVRAGDRMYRPPQERVAIW